MVVRGTRMPRPARRLNKRFESVTAAATTKPAAPRREDMRVKLCARCPYTPHDLAEHYDPEAALHACATCDGEQAMLDRHDPGGIHRRRKCTTTLSTARTARPNVAPFATESSASSATIAGEPPSVPSVASLSSRPAGRATADGYGDFEPLDYSGEGNTIRRVRHPGRTEEDRAEQDRTEEEIS
jgi:hypothetical protein